jgi:hypothetical protein
VAAHVHVLHWPTGGRGWQVNNTANYREQCFQAKQLVESGELGEIHHVLCVMYSPLMFLFDDPANDGCAILPPVVCTAVAVLVGQTEVAARLAQG